MSNPSSEHIYRRYEEDLGALRERLLFMGRLAEERLQAALMMLADHNMPGCADVVRGDEPMNRLHLEIDDRSFKLFALRQPMAVDLRSIISAAKISTDLERVGDLAVNIAEATGRYLRHTPLATELDLAPMGTVARAMLHDALDAYVRGDIQMAMQVLNRDDEIDAMKNDIFRTLLADMIAEPATVEPALELVLISRHLERVGDHATNIAEDVIFIVSAEDVRHHPPAATSGPL
jgi:phosphate transport system protein